MLETKVRTEPGRKTGLRLAYLTSRYPAPSTTFITNEVEGLRRRGHAIRVFSVRRPDPASLPADVRRQMAGVDYLLPVGAGTLAAAHAAVLGTAPGRYGRAILHLLTRPAAGLGARLYRLCYLAEAGLLAGRIRRLGLRHIHVHHANAAAVVGLVAARLLGIGYSFTAHGSDVLLESDLLAEKVAGARFVVTVSEYNRSKLAAVPGAGRTSISVVRTGVDPERFRPRAAGGRGGPVRLLAVGRLHPVKGFDHLLAAAVRLREMKLDFRLDLVGDGPARGALARRIDDLGLAEHVQLRGAVGAAAMPSIYGRADLFVLSSVSEGLPVVLMEAMASGLAVVATRVTGVPELVTDGVNGRLVPPADSAALAGALAALLRDPAARRRMGRAGRRTVQRGFSLDSNLDRLDRLFRSKLDDLVERFPGPTALHDSQQPD